MTVRIALSLASLWLVFVLPVKAQFWEATPAILFDDVEDLLVLPNGDVLAIVDGDGIYRSTDSGTSFIKVFDVSFVFEFGLGTNRIFAVGLRGTFISDDNGLTWNQLLPSDAWTVTAIGSDIAIGGSASIVFNSSDSGATWAIPNVDPIPYLESTAILAAVRMGDLIGYKTIFSDLMVSTNGGTTWSTVDVIDPDRLHYIDGLFYADRFDEVWTSVDLQNWNQLGADIRRVWSWPVSMKGVIRMLS